MANIKVFARLKPCQNINQQLIKREDQALYISSHGQVETNAGISAVTGVPEDNSKWLRFRFAHVFRMDSSQKNVFEVAAKDVVEAFLEGYNGTIFAYGQTGAGKTHTMQGVTITEQKELDCSCNASEHFGLTPQSLSFIFQKLQRNQHETVNLHVSFLEIYKEMAYDLLGPLLFKGPRKIKELPKVLVTMGGKGSCHLHGLSCHHVTSEKEAIRLYHLGIANRKIAETTSNQRSSRSHTIFTIALSRQRNGAEIFFRSKLYLVDLAGSERVWKSNAVEQQLSEAKFINLSLHHLESVIIALQKFSARNLRSHGRKKKPAKCLNRSSSATLCGAKRMDAIRIPEVNVRLKSASAVELGSRKGRQSQVAMEYEPVRVPYRNSLLTMVLQDSLGGNCNSVMIATLSLEEKNMCETISTCRFAQRVARIMNEPILNEEIDKDAVIKRLQATLAKLYLELATYKASEQESVMVNREHGNSHSDEQECVAVMNSYLAGRINDPVAHGINSPTKFRTTLRYLRQMFVESSNDGEDMESADERDSGVRTSSEPTSPMASEAENDHVHFTASNFTLRLPSPLSTIANAGSEHRSSITRESGISVNTDHEEHIPDPDMPGASSASPQPSGLGTSEVATQTIPMKTSEERKSERDICAEDGGLQPVAQSREDVWIMELELQKETLLNRSKMFASRLADQRARLIVMARQGAVPEELENEKIVELQLQKKQREVENKLCLVIKKLADLKYTDRLQQSHEKELCFEKQAAGSREKRAPACTASSSQVKDRHRAVTQTCKELELKEASTRQKLLACREQMRNFVFSSPASPLGMSCQSPASASSCRFGTGQASLSSTSSMTLLWEDADSRQTSPTPPLNNTSVVVKPPPRPKSRMSDSSLRMNKTAPNARSSFLRRALSNQERLSRKGNCATPRRDAKRFPLVEYIKNSHEAIYNKSTFPLRIENSVHTDSSSVKKAPRKMPKRQGASVRDDETSLSRDSARSWLQLNENSSEKAEGAPTKVTDKVREEKELDTRKFTESEAQFNHESRCTSYESLHLSSPEAVTEASEPRDEIRDRNSPSLICLKREERERVKKIRDCVNAAEVIQRTWRSYKKHGNSESDR